MGLLEEILVKVQKLPLDQQVKQFCDKILEEEKGKDEHFIVAPKGPNIFLNLQVPAPTPDDVAFLCLERQFEGKYIVSLRNLQRVWPSASTELRTRKSHNMSALRKCYLYLLRQKRIFKTARSF